MTNFEHYKDEILEIIDSEKDVAVFKDKPIACSYSGCNTTCRYNEKDCLSKGSKQVIKWLYEEYVEPPKQPKLTKKERQFCELVETGWISRDKDGKLSIRTNKPIKREYGWIDSILLQTGNLTGSYNRINEEILHTSFSFITWEDKEPWSIKDLLKLEVEE